MTNLIVQVNNGTLFLSQSQVAKTLGRSTHGIQDYLHNEGIQAHVIGSTKKYCAHDIAELVLKKRVEPFRKIDGRGKESSWELLWE